MAIILDTDVVIHGENGTFDLENWLVSLRDEQFEIAAVTIAELGMALSEQKDLRGRHASGT
jgi:predicted nucleic acid-binding protein